MTNPLYRSFIRVLLTAVAVVSVGALNARAQETSYKASFAENSKEAIAVNVLVGQSRVINFDRQIGRFSISNPEVCEAVMVTPTQVLVNGKGFGQVNFIAWDKSDDRFIVFDVFVRANLSLIDAQIRALFPKDDIRLQANSSVVLSGTVRDPQSANRPTVWSRPPDLRRSTCYSRPLQIFAQVQLQIRVAEVSRNKLRELGSSYLYQGSPGAGGFISGGGPGSLSSATSGVLAGTFASSLNLFVMGGNMANMIRLCRQTALCGRWQSLI